MPPWLIVGLTYHSFTSPNRRCAPPKTCALRVNETAQSMFSGQPQWFASVSRSPAILHIGLFCSCATAQSRVRVVSASERDLDPNHYPNWTTSSSTRLSAKVCSPPARFSTLCPLLSTPQLVTGLIAPSLWCTHATLHFALQHAQEPPCNLLTS